MGDHRASIKIEMSFHGITEKTDMWINYWPEECCGMDKRVAEFFNDVYRRGIDEYNKTIHEYDKEQQEKELKKKELAELKRLKDKYEDTETTK